MVLKNEKEKTAGAGKAKTPKSSVKENGRESTSSTNDVAFAVFTFDFPEELCGRLIGKQGRNISKIKEKSGAVITIKPRAYNSDWKIVCLEGLSLTVSIQGLAFFYLIHHSFLGNQFKSTHFHITTDHVPTVYI